MSELELVGAIVAPRPRRRLTRIDRVALARLAWAVVAVTVALFAQGYLERRVFLADGFVMLTIAGLILARTARGTLTPTPESPDPALPGFADRRAFAPGAAVVTLGAAASVGGLYLFGSGRDQNLAWIAYAASLVIALVGVYLLDNRPRVVPLLVRNWPTIAAITAITVVALVARLYRLGEIPFGLWADEAFAGLEIQRIIHEPNYRPVAGAGPVQGLPAMAWYISAPLLAAFGTSESVLRAAPAIFGAFGTLAVFLLGRAMLGTIYGLAAAAVLATMSWHITFSRIAMNGIYSVTLNTFALGLLVLGLRTRRRTLFAAGGLAFGLSINFYFAARLFVGVIGIFLLHQFIVGRMPWLRRNLEGLIIFGLFAWLAVAPLALLAYQNPRLFNERTETVSIVREINETNSYQPLYENIRKHALMFNAFGDSNGRHNLPGAPMFERTTAALAFVGLIMSIARVWRPEFSVPIAWLLVMVMGGVLSLAFEAPQGYRTIDNTVAGALLAALPIASLAERLRGLFGTATAVIMAQRVPLGVAAAAFVVAAAGIAIGTSNIDRYYNRQARDQGSWAAHSTPETIVAREMAFGGSVGKPYIDQTLMDHPSIRFIAPGTFPNTRFDPATSLPFRDPEGATVFLNAEATNQVATVLRLYPDATLKEHRNPAGGPPVLFEILVPPEIISRVQGSDVRIWAGAEPAGEPVARQTVRTIGELAPLDVAAPFIVEWRSILAAPEYGRYAFRLSGPASAVLKLDETDLIKGGEEAGATLARGNHALSIVMPDAAADAVALLWRAPGDTAYAPVPPHVLFRSPVTNNGLLGSYFRGTTWTGDPGLVQIDPGLQFRFHLLPLPRPYSVEWRGKVYIPAEGAYRFGASSIDESWIYIDERLIVDNSRQIGAYGEGGLVLSAGFHDIRVRFIDRTGHTFINVFWTPPARQREPIPTEYLFPPLGSYPDKVVPPPQPRTAPPNPASAQAQPAAAPPPKPGPSNVQSRPGPGSNVPAVVGQTTAVVGAPGTANGLFNQPRAAALDRAGNLYVADTENHRVQKFDASGTFVLAWGNAEELQEPLGIATDSSNNVLVLDSLPGWIKRYTPHGTLIDQFGGPDARFYHPRSLSIDAADNTYVADTGGARVVKFNGKGEQAQVFGTRGTAKGQIAEPTGAAADPFGNVWVADSANAKLVRFGANGSPDIELSLPKAGSLHGPKVAADSVGSIYVTDPESGRVFIIGSDGTTRALIQSSDLKRPLGIVAGPDRKLIVTDVTLHQIVTLTIPEGF
ncbi:MAG: hypothetical protein EPO26_05740 [Chloroflexota bacterium]|nr:MAG: hypothetical protein EPO26_05740 [Chloroflexota bacterium]